MNISVEIKEGNKRTQYTVDFSPTESAIKEIAKTTKSFIEKHCLPKVKSVMPNITKKTKIKRK